MTTPAFLTWPLDETISREGWTQHEMRLWQEQRCAMCGDRDRDGLVMDHDHMTGFVRGMLCRSCNSEEGHAGDRSPWVEWRTGTNPASRLGVVDEYHYFSAGQRWLEIESRKPVDQAALDAIGEAVTR